MVNEKTRVTKISIGRLKNLGNFEHVRYEITVEVNPIESAAAAFAHIDNALHAICAKRPDAWNLSTARRTIERAKNGDNIDVDDLARAETIVATADAIEAKRDEARLSLDAIGLSEKYTDHKLNWDQDGH